MRKLWHEIRDPIHAFVRLHSQEREILDSRPFQRLRHIRQLGMSHFIYPSANHTRFEHSLGVMELATRVFDTVTDREHLRPEISSLLPEVDDADEVRYWRRALRAAALCHDVGHLPFSHVAERELLPDGWDHERLTTEIVLSEEMRDIWSKMTPCPRPEDIVKLALGREHCPNMEFSDWEAILAEIIVGEAFGVDRMDYLLRDSHHAGVPYGEFDHFRLIDTLRILPPPPDESEETSKEPTLGVEEGGLHCAEALLLARYFMYRQVYFHPVRRIYDIHLKEFLKEWLPDGEFPTTPDEHLAWTDNEVTAGLLQAASDKHHANLESARRVVCRDHFKLIYEPSPGDRTMAPDALRKVWEGLATEYGEEDVRQDEYHPSGGLPDFPVLQRDGRVASSMALSKVIPAIPGACVEYVFIHPELRDQAESWLDQNRTDILRAKEGQ